MDNKPTEPGKKGILGKMLSGPAERKGGRAPDEREIQTWLAARLAEELKVDPRELDFLKPFAEFGMDSRAAVGIVGDIERWMHRKLSPTLLWDFPNIEALAKHLATPE
jgi:acyl carrier protein